MNNILYGFVLTFISGLSTLIGYFAIFIKGDKRRIISFSLSFASGVMATICIIDLIPSAFSYLNKFVFLYRILYMLCFIIVGFIISSLLDKHLPDSFDGSLYRVGFLTMLGIIIHNIPEGIVTFVVSQVDLKIGVSLAVAIALHNIPEGISISIPLYYSTKSKLRTFFYVLIAGCSELFGGLVSFVFLSRFISNVFLGVIFSIIAGIMLDISLSKLLKESFNYDKRVSLIGFIFGGVVMLIGHFMV